MNENENKFTKLYVCVHGKLSHAYFGCEVGRGQKITLFKKRLAPSIHCLQSLLIVRTNKRFLRDRLAQKFLLSISTIIKLGMQKAQAMMAKQDYTKGNILGVSKKN